MAVPKRRKSRARRDQRRAHHDKIEAPTLVACPTCGDAMVPHRVCPHCGHYKCRKILDGDQDTEA